MMEWTKTVSNAAKVAGALLLLLPLILLMKLVRLLKSYYPLRLWLVERGYFDFYSPDEDAVRECPDCAYIGVLAVDKHRAAPISKTNWELRCPKCRLTIEGPIHADQAGEYMSHCHRHGWIPPITVGGFAAYKSVEHHNSTVALSLPKIRKLERAANLSQSDTSASDAS